MNAPQGAQGGAPSGVSAHARDFGPAWHLKALLISAAALLACLLAAWKVLL